jgi:PPM family protein phosphatase
MQHMAFVTSTLVGMTDKGLVRENNEDCFVLGYPKTGQRLAERCRVTLPVESNCMLFLVSDGMGGARAGEVASKLTVDTIMKELPRLPPILSPHCRLEAAIEAANLAVWNAQRQEQKLQGMGATVTAVLVDRDRAYISEVGDSRAYVIRDERIHQLTSDQTILQLLIDSGAVTAESASSGIHRNMLLQAIGQEEYLQVACSSMRVKNGDIFLLCSDGLSGKLTENEIKQIVKAAPSLNVAAQQLINTAKERGGEDNITVILVLLEGEDLDYQAQSFSGALQVLTKFDPEQETLARPPRQVRPATFDDWVSMAFVDFFTETTQQRATLMSLDRFGEYILFRRGDGLVFQGERGPDTMHHYWLVSGRYRVEIELKDGERKTLALIVPPTDQRTNDEILLSYDPRLPIKRQFFTASMAMLNGDQRNATIWCEDDENIAIRVPLTVYQRVVEILGSRFLNTVRHS